MQRGAQDPITPHSERLCGYMNDSRSGIVLSYARYFGEHTKATKARMVEVDRSGFLLSCEEDGEEHEVRVAFAKPLHTVSQVRDTLMSLAKEAEATLGGNKDSAQGSPQDKLFFWPGFGIESVSIIAGLLMIFYLDNFPGTTNPVLQWVREISTPKFIHESVVFASVVHTLEAVVSLYFTFVVGRDIFKPSDKVRWFFAVFVFGYKSLVPLIRLVYRQRAQKSKSQ